jgi:hypothetical protein
MFCWHHVPRWLESCHIRSLTDHDPKIELRLEIVAALVRSEPSALPGLWSPSKQGMVSHCMSVAVWKHAKCRKIFRIELRLYCV